MKIKHIYWFAFFNLYSPSVRYRGKYVLEHLSSKSNISYTFFCPEAGFANKMRFLSIFLNVLFFRKKNSLIVFQKLYSTGLYAGALKLILFFRRKKTVYDIDDAEYLRFPEKNINYFMAKCETCTVGSTALFEYAKHYNPQVVFLTSPVISHTIQKKERGSLFTIGWIGEYAWNDVKTESFSHKTSLLTLIFPALATLNFNLKLVLLGIKNKNDKQEIENYFSTKKNITLEIPETINWFDESEIYKRISEFDIGLSPLTDNEFNRSKSAFKLKQCLSCGVPVLASPVGENKNILINGKTGIFCNTADEFANSITFFNTLNDEEYRKFSVNARISSALFSMDKHGDNLLNHFEKEVKITNIPIEPAPNFSETVN